MGLLQWGDIDIEASTPKSGKSRRVDGSRQLTKVLRTHLTSQKAETLRRGAEL